MRNIHLELPKIIAWATDAAHQHIDLAKFNGEEPDPEPTMGLQQSFRMEFPLEEFVGDARDLSINVAFEVYRTTVKTFANWNPPAPPVHVRRNENCTADEV